MSDDPTAPQDPVDPTAVQPAVPPPVDPPPPAPGTGDEPPKEGGKGWRIAVLVLLAAIVVLLLVALLTRDSDDEDSDATTTTSTTTSSTTTTEDTTTTEPTTTTAAATAPAITSLEASEVACPDPVTLTWESEGATEVEIAIDNPDGVYEGGLPANGSLDVPAPCDGDTQTYYVTAIDDTGGRSSAETLTLP